MIRGSAINELVTLLTDRGVYLWHACQFKDYQSYLILGGIPSRKLLEESGNHFTTFETDERDIKNEVWDKVFANLSDFGYWFATKHNTLPNPYGPIAIRIKPQALNQAEDVAICLRSAGARDFNREYESLSTIEDCDRLFVHPVTEGMPKSIYVKFKPQLREIWPNAEEPEVSCTIRAGLLPISSVDQVIVDPYICHENQLVPRIEEVTARFGSQYKIHRRRCIATRCPLYADLATVIVDEGVTSLDALAMCKSASDPLKEWGESIRQIDWQFSRFARYLKDGTLLPLLNHEA